MVLQSSSIPRVYTALKTPKAFPKARRQGCARQPMPPRGEFLHQLHQSTSRDDAKKAARDAWEEWASAAEGELCGLFDAFKGERMDARYCGRGAVPTTAQRYALPRRAAGRLGGMDQGAYSDVWAMSRVQEMLALASRDSLHGGLTAGQATQRNNLVHKLCGPHAIMVTHGANASKWANFIEQLRPRAGQPRANVTLLETTLEWIQKVVNDAYADRSKTAATNWRRWIRRQVTKTGVSSAAYAFMKRTEEHPDVVTWCKGARTAAPQDVVD